MSTSILPGDSYMMGLTLLVTIAFQLTCFFFAYQLQVDTLTDLAGSLNFILLALLTYFGGNAYSRGDARAIALTTLVVVSRAELGLYLLTRVLRRGKDARFDRVRNSFVGFLIFWIFQMVWVWGVSLPLIFVNSSSSSTTSNGQVLTSSDWIGVAIFIAGFILQVIADVQKDIFRSNPAFASKWCDVGVWKWSRHPNFAGEIIIWWGAFILAAGVFSTEPSGWSTIMSPLLTMLILLCGSGIPTAEGDNQLRWMKTQEQTARFKSYRLQTSPLIPMPPFIYKSIPMSIKRWFLFEWERYEASESTSQPLITPPAAK